jgi:hypothetical protein
MAACVIDTNCTYRKVKGLGWLLRHRKDGIKQVHIHPAGIAGEKPVLDVDFEDGRNYMCHFEDLSICLDWVAKYLVKNQWVTRENLTPGTIQLLGKRLS